MASAGPESWPIAGSAGMLVTHSMANRPMSQLASLRTLRYNQFSCAQPFVECRIPEHARGLSPLCGRLVPCRQTHPQRSRLIPKTVVTDSRPVGLWRMMTGYRLTYLWATLSLGVAAVARTGIYLLLGYFVDNVLGQRGQVGPAAAHRPGLCGAGRRAGRHLPSSAASWQPRPPRASPSACATISLTTSSGCRSPTTTRRPPAS